MFYCNRNHLSNYVSDNVYIPACLAQSGISPFTMRSHLYPFGNGVVFLCTHFARAEVKTLVLFCYSYGSSCGYCNLFDLLFDSYHSIHVAYHQLPVQKENIESMISSLTVYSAKRRNQQLSL